MNLPGPAQPRERPRFSGADVVAGLTVALILVPQAIAYASLAGLPPIYGLYAAALPPMAAAIFASSPYLQTGPVAMTSVLTFGALSTIALPFSEAYIALAALLALTVGVARILIGALRAGFIAFLMSEPILIGFTSAAAILIAAAQLPAFLGVSATGATLLQRAFSALSQPHTWSLVDLYIGSATLACIFGGRRLHPAFPGALIAVVAGIAYSSSGAYAGPTVGAVPSGWPALSLNLPWADMPNLLLPGVVIALVGFAEPAAIARAMATQTRTLWNSDREFISQGVANVAASISGTFPVGGSFSRTWINYSAGGQTRWSGFVTGLLVFMFMPFTAALEFLPLSVIAAIVIAAVFKLMRFRALVEIVGTSRAQAAIAWTTFALTLLLAPRIDHAVLIGVSMAIGVHLWRERRVLVNADYDKQTRELRVEPVGVIFFGSAAALGDALLAALAREPAATALLIDLRKVGRIDYTGVSIIKQIATDAEAGGMTVHIIAGQYPQGQRLLERALGPDSPWLK